MDSLWNRTAGTKERKSLEGDCRTEVAVIGAGMAGVLTGYLLQEAGLDVLLLEQGRTGDGVTAGTTAKITSQHGLIYGYLEQKLGRERAARYGAAGQEAIERYREIAEKEQISCSWREADAYLYSTSDSSSLEQEARTAQKLGLPASFTTETELPFPVKGAVRFRGQAMFHPLRFLYGLAEKLEIREQTRVTAVRKNKVMTDRGIVTAEYIVFACHYPFVNIPGFYFTKLHQERSYVMVLEQAGKVENMYLGVGGDSLSVRSWDRYLLLGGEGHRTGENRRGGNYDNLKRMADWYWPEGREVLRWSAQDCMPADRIPYLGVFAGSRPHWYLLSGFGKWGMTGAMTGARIVRDSITGREEPYRGLFSPVRFRLPREAGGIAANSRKAVTSLAGRILKHPEGEAQALEEGQAGIIRYEGRKWGAYREPGGTVCLVSNRCPHLGCGLEWNPEEKSWDCPCHGSRFDYRGRLLDNPAQKEAEHEKLE